jgi:hypothetical protein
MLELPVLVSKSRNHVALGHHCHTENTGFAVGRLVVRRHANRVTAQQQARNGSVF